MFDVWYHYCYYYYYYSAILLAFSMYAKISIERQKIFPVIWKYMNNAAVLFLVNNRINFQNIELLILPLSGIF